MDSTITAYRDAATAFLAGIAGQEAFRALQSGERIASMASWRAFRGFGMNELLRNASLDEQVRVIAAVSIEAGRALYSGPVMEGGGIAMLEGAASFGDDVLLAMNPSSCVRTSPNDADGDKSIVAAISAFPYGNLATTLVVPAVANALPLLVAVNTHDEAVVLIDRLQVDGSVSSELALDAPVDTQQIVASGDAATSAIRSSSELLLLSTSARLVGIAECVNEIVNEYIAVRTQFGKTLASFQALQHRVVDAHIEVELANALLWRTVADWENVNERSAVLFALKSHTSRTALLAARQGVQLFGGMGFSEEGPIGSYLKHAMVLAARYGGEAIARKRYREHAVNLLV